MAIGDELAQRQTDTAEELVAAGVGGIEATVIAAAGALTATSGEADATVVADLLEIHTQLNALLAALKVAGTLASA